jgi:hypothetical protein
LDGGGVNWCRLTLIRLKESSERLAATKQVPVSHATVVFVQDKEDKIAVINRLLNAGAITPEKLRSFCQSNPTLFATRKDSTELDNDSSTSSRQVGHA